MASAVLARDRDIHKGSSRLTNLRGDVWSIINEAAVASPKQPIVNMGQGFYGYNPPQFALDAAKEALTRVECNQYSPTRGRPRLQQAIADAHSASFGRKIDPKTEVTVTTGANEGMFCAFLGHLEPGDEVIVFEPFFDQYISNIEMAGGKVVTVPMHPPPDSETRTTSANEWRFHLSELQEAITPRTRMLVLNSPHNPLGTVYTRDELQQIGDLCVKNNILILSDEVYDRLYYTDFTRIATLSPEIGERTLTVGSGGKNFYCTGWRVGWMIGPPYLINPVAAAHTRVCFCSPSPTQEAVAVAFEQADAQNFWESSRNAMLSKIKRFCAVFDELGMPYSIPQGGYFVMANMAKVKLPGDYDFPEHVRNRPRDFKVAWFLIMEIGVAAIPPTEFVTEGRKGLVENFMRFAVCKEDDVLEQAKERLRGLKRYF